MSTKYMYSIDTQKPILVGIICYSRGAPGHQAMVELNHAIWCLKETDMSVSLPRTWGCMMNGGSGVGLWVRTCGIRSAIAW